MNVYVDELPGCCKECPCRNYCMDYGVSCNLADTELSYDFYDVKRHENCPLQSLTDYTKKVRMELLQEIDYSALIKMSKKPDNLSYKDAIYESFKERLDQIQGETK